MRKSVVVFGTCIILIGAVFNISYVNSGTVEGKMHELYVEVDPDDKSHIGGEH